MKSNNSWEDVQIMLGGQAITGVKSITFLASEKEKLIEHIHSEEVADVKTIRYDLIGAIKARIKQHPQETVERLGMKVLSFEAVPIADCAIMVVENCPDKLPPYIDLI